MLNAQTPRRSIPVLIALAALGSVVATDASADGTGVIVPTQGNVHGAGVNAPTQGNVHGTGVIVPTQGNVHGPGGTGVIEPNRPGQPGASGSPQAPNPPGQVISCHPGTGCTLTPGQPPAGSPAPNPPGQVISCHPGTGCTLTPTQPAADHDHDYDHDHGRWSHRDRRGWDFPVIEVTGYAPDSCVYAYRFRTIYLPGFGLERVIVKVCEAE
jgi:hypothetical protein